MLLNSQVGDCLYGPKSITGANEDFVIDLLKQMACQRGFILDITNFLPIGIKSTRCFAADYWLVCPKGKVFVMEFYFADIRFRFIN